MSFVGRKRVLVNARLLKVQYTRCQQPVVDFMIAAVVDSPKTGLLFGCQSVTVRVRIADMGRHSGSHSSCR